MHGSYWYFSSIIIILQIPWYFYKYSGITNVNSERYYLQCSQSIATHPASSSINIHTPCLQEYQYPHTLPPGVSISTHPASRSINIHTPCLQEYQQPPQVVPLGRAERLRPERLRVVQTILQRNIRIRCSYQITRRRKNWPVFHKIYGRFFFLIY
jgi:hypothetical protein